MNDNFKILVVDDEIEICKIINRTLSVKGYIVDAVHSIAETKKYLSSNVPNLIILDKILPDGDGIEFAKELTTNPKFHLCYILLISGAKTTVEDQVKGIENGAVDFIIKPIRPDDLLARVKFIFRVLERETAKRNELEKINDKLKISEKRFNNLLENFPNGVIAVFDRKYRFFYADGDELSKLNLVKGKIIGRTLTDVFPQPIALKLMTFYDGVWRDNKIEFEIEINDQTYLNAVTPIKDETGHVYQILVIIQNISALRKAEIEMRKSEAKYRRFFEQDLTGDYLSTPEGRILDCNPAFVKIMGYDSKEDIQQINTVKFYSSNEKREEFLAELSAKKNLIHNEYDQIRKDGSIAHIIENVIGHFDSDGNLEQFHGYIFDITDRVEAENKLREQEELIRITNESISEVVWRINSNLNFEYVSPSIKTLLGFSPEEVIGKSIFDIFPEDQKKEVLDSVNSRGDEKGTKHYEHTFLNKDGSRILVDLSSSPLLDENGKITGFSGVARDVTSKRKAELALKESEEKFRVFMDYLPAGVFIKDEKGKYEYLNKFNEDNFGNTDWKGKTAHDLFDKEIADSFRLEDEKVLKEGPFNSNVRVNDIDGKQLYFKTQYFTIERPDSHKLIAGISVDVTEETEAKIKLEESQENYKTIFESSALGIFRSTPEGRYKQVNDSFAKILGFDSAEQLLNEVDDICKLYKNPADRDKITNAFARFGFVKDYEVLGNHSKNKIVWVSVNASAHLGADGEVYYEGTIQDITERKLAEDELRTSKLMIEEIINAVPVSIFWKDKNLVYLGCNLKFAKDAGFRSPKEIIGKDDYEMGWSEQAELYRTDDMQVIKSGISKLLIEEEQTSPLGDKLTLLTNKKALRNSRGEIYGVLGTYLDITKRKKAEKILKDKMDELERFNKLMVGRENKMADLKEEVNELLVKLGKLKKYKAPDEN